MAIELIAHRGASKLRPENTLAAFHLAGSQRCDRIELDVRLSSDGQPIIYHDDDLLRLTRQNSRVEEMRAAELIQLPVLPDQYPPMAETRIPLLSQVLEEIETPLYVEMKTVDDSAWNQRLLEACLTILPPDGGHVLASFDTNLVRRALKRFERCALICNDLRSLDDFSSEENSRLYALSLRHTRVDARICRRFQDQGIRLWAWTADSEEEILRLIGLEVDGICSNDVQRARELLDRMES